MSLKIPWSLLKEVLTRGAEAFPQECCGFLIGPAPKDFEKPGREVLVYETRALPNGWEEGARTHRYQIDPKVYAKTEASLPESQAIVGFYHSHPSVPAWPSPFDLERAWPCCSYLIVCVRDGQPKEYRSWMRSEDGNNFVEEEIVMLEDKLL